MCHGIHPWKFVHFLSLSNTAAGEAGGRRAAKIFQVILGPKGSDLMERMYADLTEAMKNQNQEKLPKFDLAAQLFEEAANVWCTSAVPDGAMEPIHTMLLACPSHWYHIVSHMTYHACSTIELALSYLSLPIGGMISNKEVWLHNYLTQDMREDGIYKAFYPRDLIWSIYK